MTPGLILHTGVMGSGKSTQALMTAHRLAEVGPGALVSCGDRSLDSVNSRIGLTAPARTAGPDYNFGDLRGIEWLVVDEAQFATVDQVAQMVWLVDELDVYIEAFSLASDFRGQLFPGTAHLWALADQRHEIAARTWCSCGEVGRINARIIDGQVMRDGPQVLIGDLGDGPAHYEVLCRRCWRRRSGWGSLLRSGANHREEPMKTETDIPEPKRGRLVGDQSRVIGVDELTDHDGSGDGSGDGQAS